MHSHGKYAKILIADNAKEFIGKEITLDCEAKGVKLQPIVPYHPEENSPNKRVHRTIHEAARSIISHAKLLTLNWDSAVLDATYKYNTLPHSATKQIP